MSRIDGLISRLCPNGVPYRALGDVVSNLDSLRRPVTRSARRKGQYPYYGANGVQDFVDEYLFDGTFLLLGEDGSVIQRDGSPVLNWATGKIWVNNHAHVLTERSDGVNLRFLYFYLQTVDIGSFVTGSAQPKLNQGNMNRIPVPVPPREVQSEIASTLGALAELETQLEAQLKAELELRSRQYAFYRDSLLAFADRDTVRWATLTEVGTLYNGLAGKVKADFQDGNARFVTYLNVFNNLATDTTPATLVKVGAQEHQNEVRYGDVLFTASSESAEEVGMASGVTVQPPEPLYLNSFCFGFRPNDPSELNPEFSKHLFRSAAIRSQIIKTANGVTRINISKERFRKVEIPIPAPANQARLAALLDRFEALTNDLSVGLPAEIKARRAQYEYCRDRLLTFEELAG
jgi:type I restriction enzyme S subunit